DIAVTRMSGDQSSYTAIKPYAIASEDGTNLRLHWIELITDIQTQVSIMLASDDVPDVFLGGLTTDLINMNPSLFQPLETMLPIYGAHVLDYYHANKIPYENLLTYDDGHIYSLMGGFYSNRQNLLEGIAWINQAWLDKVGLKKPTTTDELYAVLQAFKAQDMDGNGDPTNEIPLAFANDYWCANISEYLGMFGITGNYNIEGGKVVPTMNTQAYRDYLEYFHKLYVEGLIDQEGFSQKGDQYVAANKAMMQGIFSMWAPQTTLGVTAEAADYVPLGAVSAPGYTYVQKANHPVTANMTAFTVTTSCEYPEAALRWWDYLSSTEELRWLTARGIEGYCYEHHEDGNMYLATPTDEEKAALIAQNHLAAEYNPTYTLASFYLDNVHPLLYANFLYTAPEAGQFPTQGYWRGLAIDELEPYNVKEVMSKNIVPTAFQEEFDFACEGLEDYLNAFRAECIINGIDDAKWQVHQSKLESYHYAHYLHYYQCKLDGLYE
ncbi:MAG: hypothetical protein RR482_07005, partial [Clostridia bacterium]